MLTPHATDLLAALILIALAATPWVCILIALLRTKFTPLQLTLMVLSDLLAKTLWRAQVSRPLPIPPGQGAIIVCNHTSPVDPWFVQLATNRLIHWMVAREYCCNPYLSWFFRAAQSIPVGRGGIDTAATRQAIRYCEEGKLVGMFPEGRLNVSDEFLMPGRPGVALIALAARVPVLPCYISGAPRGKNILNTFFVGAKTRLITGELIDLSAYYGQEKNGELRPKLTLRFMREIAKLAGIPDYRPTLAGRRWKPEAE